MLIAAPSASYPSSCNVFCALVAAFARPPLSVDHNDGELPLRRSEFAPAIATYSHPRNLNTICVHCLLLQHCHVPFSSASSSYSNLTISRAWVAFCTSSGVSPGAISSRTSPFGVTLMYAISGYDCVHHLHAGERQSTFLQDLGRAVAKCAPWRSPRAARRPPGPWRHPSL